MYNGVGLATPRGTGTSGYVQKNAGFVDPSKVRRLVGFEPVPEAPPPKKHSINKDIADHNRKREIEVKVLEYEDELTEKGYKNIF